MKISLLKTKRKPMRYFPRGLSYPNIFNYKINNQIDMRHLYKCMLKQNRYLPDK